MVTPLLYTKLLKDAELSTNSQSSVSMSMVLPSPGSISFYCEAQQFIIAVDVLFFKSIGRTDLAGGNYDTLIQSIKTNLFTLPAETKVYAGHGITTTIGQERTHNPFLQ